MTATMRPPRPPRTKGRVSPEDIAKRSVVLFVERRHLRLTAPMDAAEVIDADAHALDVAWAGASKKLFNRKVTAAVRTLDGAMRVYLESRAVACSMLARGMWLLPLALVGEVSERVAQWQAERAALGDVLVEGKAEADPTLTNYEWAKQEARAALGDQYREEDYPTPAEVKAKFVVTTRWITYNVPEALKEASDAAYQAEMARVKQEWANAGVEMERALGEVLATLVEKMAERLGVDEEGKPKVFRDSTVEQMMDFLNTFAARNLTGSESLAKLVRQAQGLLKGVQPEDLRKTDLTRERVRKGMEQITAKLAAEGVRPAPKRRLIMED